MAEEQFSLCWDNFQKNMSHGMQTLLENEDLVDVTIAVEGKYLKAHKTVLSICSPYFKELFQTNPCKHPIVFMKDVSYVAMNDLLTFMYHGEVQVNQEHLTTFIKTAESLQIKGLTGDGDSEVVYETSQTQYTNDEIYKPNREIISSYEEKSQSQNKIVKSRKSMKRLRLSQSSDKEGVEEIIEFKMEPLIDSNAEQSLNDSYENLDDEYKESEYKECDGYKEVMGEVQTVDAENIEDMEDFSIEGDEEPQPSTSEQVMDVKDLVGKRKQKQARTFHKIVHKGFFYNISSTCIKNKRYYRCGNKKNTGCLATAVLDKHAPVEQLCVLRPHNHPPDIAMEMKYRFEMELTKAVKNSNASIKSVYESLALLNPEAASLLAYDANLFTRLKRRRAKLYT